MMMMMVITMIVSFLIMRDDNDDDDDDDDVQSGSIGDCPGLQPIRQECSPALLNCLR